MNKNLHRVIFNQKTGAYTAVAEIACTLGKACSTGNAVAQTSVRSGRCSLRLHHIAVGIAALFGSITVVDAQVVAYREAPGNQRPTVLQAANGVPLVNIQTPSAQGISRNVYSQFDVDGKGVILNNAQGSVKTELGGYVQGNPWLALGTAKVIVNEVNSVNPSYLRGYVEVAGDRAQVVIANPAGLYVENAGFIGASRATLTTGLPSIDDGVLNAYRVNGGTITIGGNGLDARSTDYTDIMARAVQVNASIWSRNLKVSTGVNHISADHHQITAATGATGPAPAYAIDVGRLGGMYSGQIVLVGTEHGVGMNNAGIIGAGAGDVIISTDGLLQNRGSITATQDLATSAAGLDNRNSQLQAGGHARLALGNGELNNAGGLIRAGGAVMVMADSANNSNTSTADLGIQGQAVTMQVVSMDNRAGSVRADTDLRLLGSGSIDNSDGLLTAGHTLEMRDGHADVADIPKMLAIVNTGGTLSAARQLTVDSAAISGDGNLISLGNLALRLDTDLVNTGTMHADGNAAIDTSGMLSNHGKLLAGKTLAVTAAAVDNQVDGQIIATTTILHASGGNGFTNRGLIDGRDTFIDSATINNLGTGRIYGDHLAVVADTLNNMAETINGVTSAPVMAARMRMDLGASVINNSEHALLYSAGDLATGNALDARHQAIGMGAAINNNSATIAADGDATFNHQMVNNNNVHFETTVESSIGQPIVQYRINGSPDKLDDSAVRLVNKDSGQVVSDWRQMGDEDNFRLVLPSSAYPFERYGAAFYPAASAASVSPADAIWQTMGVTAPALAGPAPVAPGRSGTPEQQVAWQEAYANWQAAYDIQVASYQSLNNAITAFNNDLKGRMISEWTIYAGTEQITRTKVLHSDPGMIHVGGNLRFNSQAVNNRNSQIIAGGDHSGNSVLGTRPVNNGETGTQIVTSVGEASYTYIKSHRFKADDRRYDARPYESQSIQTSFALDITPTNGSGAQQDRTLKSTASAVDGNAGMVVRTSNPDIALPDSALFVPGNERYLIATDPQFTNDRIWLGSDAMLSQLGQDPALAMKRIGDGFYEQQLVQQQIQKAIGQRYAGNYSNNEEQYQALMDAGVRMAQTFDYQIGTALSAEQMAMLTEDIVWLVKQSVTLADGSRQEVLVPQVYLRANQWQVTGEGTLIAGANVDYQTAGDILNNATIAAKNKVVLSGDNIDNLGGRISGSDTLLQAQTDINNLGGAVDGSTSVSITAGRDINVSSTSVATANAITSGINIDRTGSVSGNNLTLSAGRDITANAAVIDATGKLDLNAARDIQLGSVEQGYTEQMHWGDDQVSANLVSAILGSGVNQQANRATVSVSRDVISQLNGGSISINAGRDLSAQGTQVTAVNALTAVAGNDLRIGSASVSASARDQRQHSVGDILGGKTVQTDDAGSYRRQNGSIFSGNTITLAAGNDASISGSNVVSRAGTQITAGNDINISAATDSSSVTQQRQEATSAIARTDGMGVTAGNTQQSSGQSRTVSSAVGSTIGASNGSVSLAAGNRYTQTGSAVVAEQGDVSISARQVEIHAGVHTEQNTLESRSRQYGLTAQITNPEAFARTADGIDLALSMANANSGSKTVQNVTVSAGSMVLAGGATRIAATGGGQDSNLTVVGSTVSGNQVHLQADHEINLLAQRNSSEEHSTSQGSAASIGASMGSNGFMLNASAAGSRDKGSSRDSSYTNTHVNASGQLVMTSGGDTNIKGGTASGTQVSVNVGTHGTGNLNIESLQDSSSYRHQRQSLGGSISAGVGRINGSIQATLGKADGNGHSVIEQSGILAGNDGFNISVSGNADLNGGVIASTEQAQMEHKNRFTSTTLTMSDIQNQHEDKASVLRFHADGSYHGAESGMSDGGIDMGRQRGSVSSSTASGISGVVGDKMVRSDQDSSNALQKNGNVDALQQDAEAQANIRESLGKQAAAAIGNAVASRLAALDMPVVAGEVGQSRGLHGE